MHLDSVLARPVGVVGTGVIGIGVCEALANRGLSVIGVDQSQAALDIAKGRLLQDMRLARLLGGDAESPSSVIDRIALTTRYSDLAEVALVVENVTEDLEIKRLAYASLEDVCSESAIFVANTSAIPISRIAALTNRPDRVVGLHFMNPVLLTRAVEVMSGPLTSPTTVEIADGLLAFIGKVGIHVPDGPGFVANRILMLAINAATSLVAEGNEASSVDRVLKECLGHRMGLLETADLIGLDTIRRTLVELARDLSDQYSPHPLMEAMIDDGLLGRKSGRGFYEYDTPRQPQMDQ